MGLAIALVKERVSKLVNPRLGGCRQSSMKFPDRVSHCLIACVCIALFASACAEEGVQLDSKLVEEAREAPKGMYVGRRLLGHNKDTDESPIIKETTAPPKMVLAAMKKAVSQTRVKSWAVEVKAKAAALKKEKHAEATAKKKAQARSSYASAKYQALVKKSKADAKRRKAEGKSKAAARKKKKGAEKKRKAAVKKKSAQMKTALKKEKRAEAAAKKKKAASAKVKAAVKKKAAHLKVALKKEKHAEAAAKKKAQSKASAKSSASGKAAAYVADTFNKLLHKGKAVKKTKENPKKK